MLQALDSLIETHCNSLRGSLLRYSLDSELFSNDQFREAASLIQSVDQIIRLPWLAGVMWGRSFYETSSGGDFKECLFRCLSPLAAQPTLNERSQLFDQIFRVWGFHSDRSWTDRHRFLSQVWLIKQGPTSEIWKNLPTILHQLSPNPDRDEVFILSKRLSEEQNLPPYFLHLIQNEDTDFADSLIALKRGQGTGWLAWIAANPMWRDNLAHKPHACVSWALSLNGNSRDLVLSLRSVHLPGNQSELKISQGGRFLYEEIIAPYDKNIWMSVLIKKGFNPMEGATVSLSGGFASDIPAPLSYLPAMFRMSPTGILHQQINDIGQDAHVQLTGAYVLMESQAAHPAVPAMTLGGQQITLTQENRLALASHHPVRLFHADFTRIDRSQPLELLLDVKRLCFVGSKPQIQVDGADLSVETTGGEQGFVVFGKTAFATLVNTPSHTETEWSVEPQLTLLSKGEMTASDSRRLFLAVSADQFGARIRLRCRSAEAVVRFLPKALQERIRNLRPAHGEGWRWQPESNPSILSNRLRQGQTIGKVTLGPDTHVNVAAPLQSAVWWFSHSHTLEVTPPNTRLDFDSHSALADQLLNLWIPDGRMAVIRLNDLIIRELNGPCHETFDLNHELTSVLTINPDERILDTIFLCMEDTRNVVAEILCSPTRPVLRKGPAVGIQVWIPPDVEPADLVVLFVPESSLFCPSRIQVIPIPELEGQAERNIITDYTPGQDEQVWYVLVRASAALQTFWQTANDLLAYVFGASRHHAEIILPDLLVEPDEEVGLNTLVERWNGDRPLSATARSTIRKRLDELEFLFSSGRAGGLDFLFRRALRQRHLIEYGNCAEVWTRHFKQHCRLDELEDLLTLMLNAGFNWMAQPNWLNNAEDWIGNRLRTDHQRWTAARREQLRDICSIIPAQSTVAAGYPVQQPRYADNTTVMDLTVLQYSQPDLFRLKFRDSQVPRFAEGIGLHGIFRQGVRVLGFAQARQTTFQYHGEVTVQDTIYHCQVLLVVNNDLSAVRHFCDRIPVDVECYSQPLATQAELDRLTDIFQTALASASPVLGTQEDRSLGYLFTICDDEFAKMAQDEPEQRNRRVLFQMATLNRLHAWLGYTVPGHPPGYPDDWPLKNVRNCDFLCRLNYRAWNQPTVRKALFQDMIPVEWMLAWFHLD